MLRLLIRSLVRFPWFKRFYTRAIYERLARTIPAAEWQFMNYGYVPNSREAPLHLPSHTNLQRHALQMYHYLAAKTNLEGKKVLEVGSGRGGGAKHIAQYYKPAFYTGMDLAQSSVDLSNRLHGLPNLKFIQGSAESIPLPDASVDVVFNVESCHAYGSVVTFFKEVERVLKPGGIFLMVDFRSNEQKETMETLRKQLQATSMQMLEEEDITQNVIRSLESENESKREFIRRLVPEKWQRVFADFSGMVGSHAYNTLKDGTRQYFRFMMKKAADA